MAKKRLEKAPYGRCLVCAAPIIYPGLDGFKCDHCGWLKKSEVAILVKKAAKK